MSETRKQQNDRLINSLGFAIEGSHGNKGWNQLNKDQKFKEIHKKMDEIEKESRINLEEFSQLLEDV